MKVGYKVTCGNNVQTQKLGLNPAAIGELMSRGGEEEKNKKEHLLLLRLLLFVYHMYNIIIIINNCSSSGNNITSVLYQKYRGTRREKGNNCHRHRHRRRRQSQRIKIIPRDIYAQSRTKDTAGSSSSSAGLGRV